MLAGGNVCSGRRKRLFWSEGTFVTVGGNVPSELMERSLFGSSTYLDIPDALGV